MNTSLFSADISVDEMLDAGLKHEQRMLDFYEKAFPYAEHDIQHLFAQLIEGSRSRIRMLADAKKDFQILRDLAGAMAD